MPNSKLNRPINVKLPTQSFAETSARILTVIRAIPPGFVASYGDVAARAGLVGRARLVARALKLNSDDNLPWQRVIRADGTCAVTGQQALLVAEGVQFQALRVCPVFWLRNLVDVQSSDDLDQFLWEI